VRLSTNFHLDEFTRSRFAEGGRVKPTHQQIYCIKILVSSIMQSVRDKFGKIRITSGIRDKSVHDGLIKHGYPASVTSDHLAWCTVNPYGTGACDFIPLEANLKEVFLWISSNCIYGQLIIYPEDGFIHVSNEWESLFKHLTRSKFKRPLLVRKDGAYHIYEEGVL